MLEWVLFLLLQGWNSFEIIYMAVIICSIKWYKWWQWSRLLILSQHYQWDFQPQLQYWQLEEGNVLNIGLLWNVFNKIIHPCTNKTVFTDNEFPKCPQAQSAEPPHTLVVFPAVMIPSSVTNKAVFVRILEMTIWAFHISHSSVGLYQSCCWCLI